MEAAREHPRTTTTLLWSTFLARREYVAVVDFSSWRGVSATLRMQGKVVGEIVGELKDNRTQRQRY